MKVEIVPLASLLPLEKVFPRHLENLAGMVTDAIRRPLVVDSEHSIVLDGSHRYAYLLREGYQRAPVVRVDYRSDEVRVGTRLRHRFRVDEPVGLTKPECVRRALAGDLLPPRTTRHFFVFRRDEMPIALSVLGRGPRRNIDHLLTEGDEVVHELSYLSELDEEQDVLLEYLSEQRETRRYVAQQLGAMRRTVFFPGKFNPPHLGHLATIMRLRQSYDVVVAVTGDGVADGWPREEVVGALRSLEGIGVRVVEVEGRLIDKPDPSGLPPFDVLASGNPDVIAWAERVGVASMYVERSGGFSSTELRDV